MMVSMIEIEKYKALREAGRTPSEIAQVSEIDGLDAIKRIKVIRDVFNFSIAEAKEIVIAADQSGRSQAARDGIIAALEFVVKTIDLEEKTRALMDEYKIPGLAIGIMKNGEEYDFCEGVTSISNPLPITSDTLFQIGSTTKTITGTIIMRLVQDGKLELDATVRTYLPDLKLADEDTAAKLTVRHLLNHTGGWVGDLFGDTGDGDDALEKYVQGVAKQPQLTPLGTVWHYNNAGFGIAGRVIEVVTGQTYERAATEMILGPLGMKHSNFTPGEAILERTAVGHYVDENGQVSISRPWAFARAISPIGRLNSSVLDQLKYAKFHLGDSSPILSSETLREMHTPTINGALGNQFAVTWFVRDVPKLDGTGTARVLSHGGATNGQMSAFWLVPERNFGCTILTNGEKGALLHGELSSWIQEHFLGLKEPEPKFLELQAQELEVYAGRYVGAAFGTIIEMTVQDGALVRGVIPGDVSSVTVTPAPPPPPATCGVLVGDVIQVLDGESKGLKSEFLRDSNGAIVWLRSSGRLYAKHA
jgi:CubicO group peptidase (beta-lactamase class C family)